MASKRQSTDPPEILEVSFQQIDDLLDRAESNTLRAEDLELMRKILLSYHQFFRMVEDKNTTIARLRKLLFGSMSEKSNQVMGDSQGDADDDAEDSATDSDSPLDDGDDAALGLPAAATSEEPSESSAGHGRYGADDYLGAEQVKCQHSELAAGDSCPEC